MRSQTIGRAMAQNDDVLLAAASSAIAIERNGTDEFNSGDLIRAMISIRGSDLGLEGRIMFGSEVQLTWQPKTASSRARALTEYESVAEYGENSGFEGGRIVSWTHNAIVFEIPEG